MKTSLPAATFMPNAFYWPAVLLVRSPNESLHPGFCVSDQQRNITFSIP
jgi:hypothetical protein